MLNYRLIRQFSLLRLHMVKNAAPGLNLDPKKSSFKKLSKFLAVKEKEGIIKVKELQKGQLMRFLSLIFFVWSVG